MRLDVYNNTFCGTYYKWSTTSEVLQVKYYKLSTTSDKYFPLESSFWANNTVVGHTYN